MPLLADDPRPRYLMGLGSPADLLDAVDQGIDLFDSVLPVAGRPDGPGVGAGRAAEPPERAFLDDPAPIEDGCPCLACRRFSRAYIAHLFRARELLGVPSRNLSQPDLHPRLHGQDPRRDRGRKAPRIDSPSCASARVEAAPAKRQVSRSEAAPGTVHATAEEASMGSRDRPSREAKKKPKDKSAAPKVQPLAEPPMNVELIRKQRKPRWDEGETRTRADPSRCGRARLVTAGHGWTGA